MSDDSKEGQFDGILMTVIQQGGGVNNYFDAVFGFLHRKTDFFANEKESRNYVDVHYKKWLNKYNEKVERDRKIRERKQKEEEARKKPADNSSATVKEITPEEYERRMKQEQEKKKEEEEKAKAPAKVDNKDKKKEDDGDKVKEGHVLPNKEKGADCENYSWGQMDIKEITITFKVPSNIRGKDIDVDITNNHLRCGIKGQKPIIDSELSNKCKPDTMIWQLEEVKNDKLVTITFEKYEQSWWECVEKDHPIKVDTGKVSPEASKLSDIEDPELKAQVEKMMFDTRQKAMGKPTSDILQKAPQIEAFMKAHPEMDFSKAQWG